MTCSRTGLGAVAGGVALPAGIAVAMECPFMTAGVTTGSAGGGAGVDAAAWTAGVAPGGGETGAAAIGLDPTAATAAGAAAVFLYSASLMVSFSGETCCWGSLELGRWSALRRALASSSWYCSSMNSIALRDDSRSAAL